MEPVYKPSARIALMKCFESSDYSSSHIHWSIGKSLSHNVKNRNVTFKAGRVELDESTKVWLYWRLEYFINQETKLINISLTRTNDDESHAPNINISVICRLAVTNTITGVTKYHVSHYIDSTVQSEYKWKLSSDEVQDLDIPDGSYTISCWLDIPTKVIGGEPPSHDRRSNCGPDLLLSSIASLFDEVISRKTDDESKGTSDIVLITEKGRPEERRFNCHRNILSVRSPVFDTMLASEFKEANERDVEMKDVDGDVMEIVLKYIYTGECPSDIDFATIPGVVDFAEQCMLPELKDECVRQLIDCELHDDDWADRLALAETYNIDYLKKICMLALASNNGAMDAEMRKKVSDGIDGNDGETLGTFLDETHIVRKII